jgi:hypothetical protein
VSYPFLRLIQRHRWVERLLPHGLVSRLVWREVEQDAEFMAGIRQGHADAVAGRTFRGRLANRFPNPPASRWRPDDPEQPDGWHHDGSRWRLNRDGGWHVDAYGFWRWDRPA